MARRARRDHRRHRVPPDETLRAGTTLPRPKRAWLASIGIAGTTALPGWTSGRDPDGPAVRAVFGRAEPTRTTASASSQLPAVPARQASALFTSCMSRPFRRRIPALDGNGDPLSSGCRAPLGSGPELRTERGEAAHALGAGRGLRWPGGMVGRTGGCFAPSTGRDGPCGRAPAIAEDDIGPRWLVTGCRAGFDSVLRHSSGPERTSPD